MADTDRTNWPLWLVTLKVLDLDAEVAFYNKFGLRTLQRGDKDAFLGGGETPLLRLRRLEGGAPRPPHTAGLYHFALLVPDDAALGTFLRHAAVSRLPFVGAADHLVSQALYFEDPEQNQIEVYSDRPRDAWRRDGKIAMDTLPLDLDRLASLGTDSFEGLQPGTVLGHMHLNVADLDRSQAFYEGIGMDLVLGFGPFRFMSYDGYHHHLGLNLFAGPGAAPVVPGVSGLESYTIARPSDLPTSATDPDGIRLELPAGVPAA
jgi:catechol 2,3-dioxygenase